MIFLIDALIVLLSFTIFICIWICTFYFLCILFCTNINNLYCTWDFISANYIDLYWFSLGSLFIICLLLSLCILLYFSCLNFVCFDICNCIGFQWYWVYFIFGETTIFSNLILESDYLVGDLRLLQCNHVLTLLSLVIYNLWLSAVDVIHSFTLSSIGVNVDCIPGSCNEIILFSSNSASLYGQCSELCGVLHGFMPIVVSFI